MKVVQSEDWTVIKWVWEVDYVSRNVVIRGKKDTSLGGKVLFVVILVVTTFCLCMISIAKIWACLLISENTVDGKSLKDLREKKMMTPSHRKRN